MKNLLTFVLLASLSAISYSKEDCSLEANGLSKDDDIARQLFYTGTCHYRNKDYDKSAGVWEKLAVMEEVHPDSQGLQIDVLNNLGYLMFFGYGIEENKEKAIEFWKKAISLGQYEAEYHLCHAYADSDEPTYNKSKAKKHCEKAYLIYSGLEKTSEGDAEILQQIKEYRANI